jgi:hypothetical protein
MGSIVNNWKQCHAAGLRPWRADVYCRRIPSPFTVAVYSRRLQSPFTVEFCRLEE